MTACKCKSCFRQAAQHANRRFNQYYWTGLPCLLFGAGIQTMMLYLILSNGWGPDPLAALLAATAATVIAVGGGVMLYLAGGADRDWEIADIGQHTATASCVTADSGESS